MEEGTEPSLPQGHSKWRLPLYVLLLFVLIGFFAIWLLRFSIADTFIQSQLDALDLEAQYEIVEIGPRRQSLENLVIGDPKNPDLLIKRVVIEADMGLSGPAISRVMAEGVRLYGQWENGRLSFGALDKLTDPDSEEPITLPDIDIVLTDAKGRIKSPFGTVGLALNGKGNLQNSFAGELAAISNNVDISGRCQLKTLSLYGAVKVSDGVPQFEGPVRFPQLSCPDDALFAEDMAAQVRLSSTESFDSFKGRIGILGGPLRYDAYAGQEVKAGWEFKGDLDQASGNLKVDLAGLAIPYGRAAYLNWDGPVAFQWGEGQNRLEMAGDLNVRKARLSRDLIGQLKKLAPATRNTPLGPLAERLVTAAAKSAQEIDFRTAVVLKNRGGEGRLSLAQPRLESGAGATLSANGPLEFSYFGNDLVLNENIVLALSGGGLPDAKLRLKAGRLNRNIAGSLQMARYVSGKAQISIPDIRFRRGGSNMDIDGRILLSGPFSDGSISGLNLPVQGTVFADGTSQLFTKCTDIRFDALRYAALNIGSSRLPICPKGRTALVSLRDTSAIVNGFGEGWNLNGRVGQTPLSLRTGSVGFSLKNGIEARDLSIGLGQGQERTEFAAALVSGQLDGQIGGKVSGGYGKIANVPLKMEDINGDWHFADGAVQADANILVRDAEVEPRFQPLISRDFIVRYADSDISASGTLLEPNSERPVVRSDIRHNLPRGSGQATLDVAALDFDDQLQPEMLTPLTLGVVANARGQVRGSGLIEWSADGVKSGGSFETDSLNLAASFGPVTGLAGTIAFSDLLAFETDPLQVVTLAEVNPGVAAFNGKIVYRLLPDFQMEIIGGSWPFSGGILRLEPAILDLKEDSERRLVFAVDGIDAAQFLSQFEFDNLTASGSFDGRLPMVFDQDGGRIEGGFLKARKGGGQIAYIGELSYEDLGTMANYAFEALRSLKYDQLTIGMEGAIDGEIITEVKFAGIQQGEGASRNFITKQIAKIPIEFNLKIQAPFMQLLSSARAYYEPELLVGASLPALLRANEAKRAEED